MRYIIAALLLVGMCGAQDHKFLDRTNAGLFAAHAAATAWDAVVTQRETSPHFLVSGGCVPSHNALHNCAYSNGFEEGNPVARPFIRQGVPGVITFFSLEVAGNIAGAYLLHKTGHHKLERVLSVVNIGSSASGAVSWTGRR